MTAPVIDLNADLGEGAGHDDELLAVVTSANVACGAHAGDAATIRRTCEAAAAHGVVVGAHPGYPDRAGFGRLPMDLSPEELAATLRAQFAALADEATRVGLQPRYVKAHGALYHRASRDSAVAELLVSEAIRAQAFGVPLVVLGPLAAAQPAGEGAAGSAGAVGVATRAVVEGFADRAYAVDAAGRPALVDRRDPGALLGHDAAVAQALALATSGQATTRDGAPVAVHPQSICVHGDGPGALALAREIRAELERAGVRVEAFA